MVKTKTKKKEKLMITHGGVTHPVNAPCKFCDKVKREFKKEMTKKRLRRKAKKKNITLEYIPSSLEAVVNKERNFGEVDIVARNTINDIIYYLREEAKKKR